MGNWCSQCVQKSDLSDTPKNGRAYGSGHHGIGGNATGANHLPGGGVGGRDNVYRVHDVDRKGGGGTGGSGSVSTSSPSGNRQSRGGGGGDFSPPSYAHSSTSNLQHISEREPDDVEFDPSLNPTKETLFMKRSLRDIESSIKKRRSIYEKNISRRRQHSVTHHRASSTATILLDDSTVTRPNSKSTVRALATAVYLQIKNRDRHGTAQFDSPEIFDEKLHPVHREPVPDDYAIRDPDQKAVYRFVRTLFQMAQLSPECAIVTMVYLERLLTSAEIEICPGNWKRILLCAILLASKVWDDQAVWNVDYCQILRDLRVDDVNELERQFLEILQFNINVPSSVYAKYYFDIRSLADTACNPIPLSIERAYKLEAYTRVCDDVFMEMVPRDRRMGMRRYGSLDTLTTLPRFRPAILS